MTRPDHHLRSDDDLVTEIVAQLERGGPLNDPRDPRASSPADGDAGARRCSKDDGRIPGDGT
jgi:hypothetical protein